MTTFKNFGFNQQLITGLDELGFIEPSPIQAQAIPFILNSEQDLIALAQTGTGKTAAFALPILQKMGQQGLQTIILCPTRELCLQISQSIKDFSKHAKYLQVAAVYGGERIDQQIRLLKQGANIVVGTPGRTHDLIRRRVLKLENIKWLVLDEADEMLDMGFKEDLDAILKEIPDDRQTLLFSATMSKGVSNIAHKYMKQAHEISIGNKNIGADLVSHEYYVVQAHDRFEALKRIIDSLPDIYGILFCRTKRDTQEIADKLRRANYDAEAIHGDVAQNIRTKIMDKFKRKEIKLLVATDVAARGIDVKNLSHIINYNLPDQTTAYTHRSGRTGRAQQPGISIAIIGPRDTRKIKELELIIGKPFTYKQVPSGDDIYHKQIESFVSKLKNYQDEKHFSSQQLDQISDKLKVVKKEDLIVYLANKELGHLSHDSKENRNLNSDVKPIKDSNRDLKDGINLKINIGKKQGLDIKSLFSLVNSHNNLRGIEIGHINLTPDNTILMIDKSRAQEVIKTLTGQKFKGQKIIVTQTELSAARSFRKEYGNRRNSRGRDKYKSNKRLKGKYKR